MASTHRSSGSQTVATHRLQSIVDRMKAGHTQEAETALAELRQRHPTDRRVVALHGDALRLMQRFDDAAQAYQDANDRGLNDTKLQFHWAACLTQCNQPKEALALIERVIHAHPDHAAAWSLKGDITLQLGQPDTALACFEQALTLDPKLAAAWQSMARLKTFDASSPIFKVLQHHLDRHANRMSARDQALMQAALGKACLDTGQDDAAFEHYDRANRIMHAALQPANAEIERHLLFLRHYFTSALFKQLRSSVSATPQILIAGMSRSGKSLVESLFRGVRGVEIAGEDFRFNHYVTQRLAPYANRMDAWLTDQTPETIERDAKTWLENVGGEGATRVTTLPGDLWYLGMLGLWLPNVPIIFCVRDVMDLGITGYFQQYQYPEGHRYSYDLHHLGRQIASYEKAMEHWAQVLPNPVYLVDYEALVKDPEQVMQNLLSELGLEREQPYEDIVTPQAGLVDHLGPVQSIDVPMPLTNRFIGIGQRFSHRLAPLVDGYRTVVQGLPRMATPATFPQPLPEHMTDSDQGDDQPSTTMSFEWTLSHPVIAVDNGCHIAGNAVVQDLIRQNAVHLVMFDPAGAGAPDAVPQGASFQYLPGAVLGDGNPATLYASLDPRFNSTLPPLSDADLPGYLHQPTMTLAQVPIGSFALDAIQGLTHVDWLILDERHDSMSVLHHAGRLVRDVLLVQAGVTFAPTHCQQPELATLNAWAGQNGFRFYRLIDLEHERCMPGSPDLTHQPAGTELRRAAALFVPDAKRMATLSDTQRLKLAFLLDTVYGTHDLASSLLDQIGDDLGQRYLTARGYRDLRRGGPSSTELATIRKALRAGQWHEVHPDLARWSEQFPGDAQVKRLQAEAASYAGDHGLAVMHMNAAIDLLPRDMALRVASIDILLRAGLWWEAPLVIDALLPRFPDHAMLRWAQWESLASHPEPRQDAITQTIAAVRDPSSHPAEIDPVRRLILLGRLYARSGNHGAAIEQYDRALALAEGQSDCIAAVVRYWKAKSLQATGKEKAACALFQQVAENRPRSYVTEMAERALGPAAVNPA